jgi:hypothetical protein
MSSHEFFLAILILLAILAPHMIEELIVAPLVLVSKLFLLCMMAAFLYFLYYSNFAREEIKYLVVMISPSLDCLLQYVIAPAFLIVFLIMTMSRLGIIEPAMFFLGSLFKSKDCQNRTDKRIEPFFDFDHPSSD